MLLGTLEYYTLIKLFNTLRIMLISFKCHNHNLTNKSSHLSDIRMYLISGTGNAWAEHNIENVECCCRAKMLPFESDEKAGARD